MLDKDAACCTVSGLSANAVSLNSLKVRALIRLRRRILGSDELAVRAGPGPVQGRLARPPRSVSVHCAGILRNPRSLRLLQVGVYTQSLLQQNYATGGYRPATGMPKRAIASVDKHTCRAVDCLTRAERSKHGGVLVV